MKHPVQVGDRGVCRVPSMRVGGYEDIPCWVGQINVDGSVNLMSTRSWTLETAIAFGQPVLPAGHEVNPEGLQALFGFIRQ